MLEFVVLDELGLHILHSGGLLVNWHIFLHTIAIVGREATTGSAPPRDTANFSSNGKIKTVPPAVAVNCRDYTTKANKAASMAIRLTPVNGASLVRDLTLYTRNFAFCIALGQNFRNCD